MDYILLVHLFHILIIGGLFLYVGIMKTKMPSFMYNLLIFVGIFLILYHSYKIYVKYLQGVNPWINYFHIFSVAPILIIIGLQKEKTPRYYFEFLLMLAFAVIGYHSYYMFYN